MQTEYFWQSRPEMKQFLPTEYAKVLEIGCGAGQFRQNLRENIEYWGIEPNAEAADRARRVAHCVLKGTYAEVVSELPANYFDLVICNDVIEHIADHDAFLSSIRTQMSANSHLVASIPNVRYIGNLAALLIRKDWRYRTEGILDNTHLRFFTEKSIRRAITSAGFQIEKLAGIKYDWQKATNFQQLLKKIPQSLAVFALGSDTQYFQFGLRAKLIN